MEWTGDTKDYHKIKDMSPLERHNTICDLIKNGSIAQVQRLIPALSAFQLKAVIEASKELQAGDK